MGTEKLTSATWRWQSYVSWGVLATMQLASKLL